MKITILNIANKMPSWVLDACQEYLKRINHEPYNCQIIEIKPIKGTKSSSENKALEAEKLLSMVPKNSFICVLDERGKNLSSNELAKSIEQIKFNFSQLTFIIGGADGVAPEILKSANLVWSLSKLVFPHTLARVILLEQIYRAISILENHPYHRE